MNVWMSSMVPRTIEMQESTKPAANMASRTWTAIFMNTCITAPENGCLEASSTSRKEVVRSLLKDREEDLRTGLEAIADPGLCFDVLRRRRALLHLFTQLAHEDAQ